MVTKKKYNIYIEKEKRKNLLQVSFEKTSRWQYIIPRGNQSSGSIRRLFIFKKGEIERLVWGRERKGGRGGGGDEEDQGNAQNTNLKKICCCCCTTITTASHTYTHASCSCAHSLHPLPGHHPIPSTAAPSA